MSKAVKKTRPKVKATDLAEPLLVERPINDRLTLQVTVNHLRHGDAPFGVNFVGKKLLETKEEAVSREVSVGPEWQNLIELLKNKSWLDYDQIGLVVLSNLEGKNLTRQPDKAEAELIAQRVVHLTLDGSFSSLLVLPGWAQPIMPSHPANVLLRCPHGPAKCRLFLYPK